MFRSIKWLYPGLRVKRWIFVIVFGVFLGNLGAVFFVLAVEATKPAPRHTFGGLAILSFVLAVITFAIGLYRLLKSVGELIRSGGARRDLVDVAFQHRWIRRGPKIVALGGGTGMSRLLSGLKLHTSDLTAVVSVADDGGSSGRLREALEMAPPGDVRKCLIALADEEPRMGELFSYRFTEGELSGHVFGNLFLAVLTRLTGNFGEAVREANRLLQVRGRVIPATLDLVTLEAIHRDGSHTVGQRRISETDKPIERVRLAPDGGPPAPDILTAIREADMVILGPGSLFTSVLPNLLIEGIPEAIALSRALKVYVCNVANQEGETRGFTLTDYLEALKRHGVFPLLDVVLANSGTVPAAALGAHAVPVTMPAGFDSRGWGVEMVAEDLIDRTDVRLHDPIKLSEALMNILARHRKQRLR